MKSKKSLQQPATKQDISALKKDVAELRSETKKDIAASRSETKKDIAGLRSETKKDIAGLRSETKKDIAGLRSETKKEFTGLRKEINTFKNETLEHFDGLAKLIKDQTEDFQLHNMTHRREQDQLDNHEERINHLEEIAPRQTGI